MKVWRWRPTPVPGVGSDHCGLSLSHRRGTASDRTTLDRAYATTSHSAQALTADRTLINAESFSRTTKQDVFYVAVSRARFQAEVFTDSLADLPTAVLRREDKTATLDIGLTTKQLHSKEYSGQDFHN